MDPNDANATPEDVAIPDFITEDEDPVVLSIRSGRGLRDLLYIIRECHSWKFSDAQISAFITWAIKEKLPGSFLIMEEDADKLRMNVPEWLLEFKRSSWYVEGA